MAVQSLVPLYQVPMHSESDIERALNYSEADKQRIKAHSKFHHASIRRVRINLMLASDFDWAYQHSKAFTPLVLDSAKEYRELLEKSISICRDLSSLFIQSLQCCQGMAEINETAKKIASLYWELSCSFYSYRNSIRATCACLSTLLENKMRELRDRRGDPDLQKAVDSLTVAVRCMFDEEDAIIKSESSPIRIPAPL